MRSIPRQLADTATRAAARGLDKAGAGGKDATETGVTAASDQRPCLLEGGAGRTSRTVGRKLHRRDRSAGTGARGATSPLPCPYTLHPGLPLSVR